MDNPFDFSEFGVRPSTATGPNGQTNPPGGGGFDPFGAEPARRPRSGEEVFTGPAVSGPADPLAVARPPLLLFAGAFAVAVVGVMLAVSAVGDGSKILPALTGWLLAGPAAIGVLAAFSSVDTRRRVGSVYSAPKWLSAAYWMVIATCALGIGIAAWQIALWAGRL